MKYFKDAVGNLYVDPIIENHKNLLEITEKEFNDLVTVLNAVTNEKDRVLSIKTKAGEIIASRYTIIWQLNHPRTDETYKAEYEWIDKIREISNKAELEGTALEDISWNLI
ncbi:MAG: hypothetical protein AB7G52_13590 [Arcobacter sp.]